jgi:hypothetical protein
MRALIDVQRLHGDPRRVDPNHRISFRKTAAHCAAADTGHCTTTVPAQFHPDHRLSHQGW